MDYEQAKISMVNNQLRPNKINDNKLLQLFTSISKEEFLPEEKQILAYTDNDIEIKKHRLYLSNLHLAQMIMYSNINKKDRILHIGSLTGYVSTLLSYLSSKVFSLEQDEELFDISKKNIFSHKIHNVQLVNDKHIDGYQTEKPFNIIFIDSIVEYIPEKILNQLDKNNGKLITIKKMNQNLCKGIKIIKNNENYYDEIIFDCFTKSRPMFEKKNEFIF